MLKIFRLILLPVGLMALTPLHTARAQWHAGRDLEDRRALTIGLTAGTMFDLDGSVRETERPLYAFTDDHSGAPPEDYSWSELGFDDRYFIFGFMIEQMWRFATINANAFYGKPEVSGTADRNFFIGVEKVRFEGETYEHMIIPEGEAYHGDIRARKLELNLQLTPVSYRTRNRVAFTPWIHLGLFAFMGDYTIDAGPAQGVRPYERPPRDYVIGGRGSGTAWIVVPEIGLGGEARIPLGARSHLTLQGHYAFLEYSGHTGDFGISSRHEKVLHVDYHTFSLRTVFEHELNHRLSLITGVEYTYRTGDAEVRAKDRPKEEVLELREKFDKDVHFQVSSLLAFVGLRF